MLYITYAVLATAVFLVVRLPIHAAIRVGIFLMPFPAFEILLGASVSISQIALAILIVRILPYSLKDRAGFSIFLPAVAFAAWAVGIAFVTLETGYNASEVSGGDFFRNGWGRVLTQLIVFSIQFGFLYSISSSALRPAPIEMLTAYLWACVALVVIGLFQVFAYSATGVNLIPIGSLSNEFAENLRNDAVLETPLGPILRMSSLGGEPKGLAVSLVVGIAALVGFWRHIPKSPRWKTSTLVLLLCGTIMTGSTSGFFLLVLLLVFLVAGTLIKQPLGTATCMLVYTSFTLGFFALYFWLAAASPVTDLSQREREASFETLFMERTVDRFGLDDTDTMITRSLTEDPIQIAVGRGMGLSHVGAEFFRVEYYIQQGYYSNQIINAKSGLTHYGGMGGVIGLLLMCALFANLVGVQTSAVRLTPAQRTLIVRLQVLSGALFCILLNRLYSADIAWLVIVLCGIFIRLILARSIPARYPARQSRLTQPMGPQASSHSSL